MKCDICDVKEATVHLTEVVNDKVTKLHLCEECAAAKSEEMQSHFGLTDLLSGLMDFETSVSEGPVREEVSAACSVCGMTYYDFQKTGKLGCGRCYDKFAKNLSELLRKIHGSDKHIGKMPVAGIGTEDVMTRQDLLGLKEELKELVRIEEFEKAALVRDKIRDIMKKLGDEAETNEVG